MRLASVALMFICTACWVPVADTEMDEIATIAAAIGAREVPARDKSGRWFDLGPIEVAPADTRAPAPMQTVPEAASSREVPYTPEEWFVVDDLVERSRHLVHYAPSTRAPDPKTDAVDADDTLVQKGWSNGATFGLGEDNRFSLAPQNYNQFPFHKAVGQTSNGCTATMLGLMPQPDRALALAAAHCVFTTAGVGIMVQFTPSAGNAAANGTWQTINISYYNQWPANSCFLAANRGKESCLKYDIVLLTLQRLSGTFIGGSVFGALTKSQISNAQFRPHVGYPNCGASGAPAGCVQGAPYEDQAWWIANWRQSDRLFDHAADLSNGHSGGPMFVFINGSDVVSGIASSEKCFGICANHPSHPTVNTATRLMTDMFDLARGMLTP